MTREQWLHEAVQALRPYFADRQLDLPEKIRVSCGWPTRGGLSASRRVIGQCFDSVCSTGGHTEVFISPFLSVREEVVETLVHELLHAAIGCDLKHGKEFRTAMKQIGLVGKPTATKAGDALREDLVKLLEDLDDYPHSALTGDLKGADTPKKQKGRQLKVYCDKLEDHEDGEEYILRGSQKTLSRGVPVCPLCGTDMTQEKDEGEGENAPE